MATEGMTTKPASVVRPEEHRRLDAWIKEATQGLCDPAVEHVRQQILEQGTPVEELGDPKEAKRAFARTHLTRWEYSLIHHLTLTSVPASEIKGGWKNWALLSSPAVPLILFLWYLWMTNTTSDFHHALLYGMIGVIGAFFGLMLFVVMCLIQRYRARSLTEALEREIYFYGACAVLNLMPIYVVGLQLEQSIFGFFGIATAYLAVLSIRIFGKACRLEGMGVPYVKPYWEKQEGEQQAA